MTQNLINDSWVEWALKGLGALLIFFISLGIKDVREKIRKVEELDKGYGVLYERVDNLARKVERLLREIDES